MILLYHTCLWYLHTQNVIHLMFKYVCWFVYARKEIKYLYCIVFPWNTYNGWSLQARNANHSWNLVPYRVWAYINFIAETIFPHLLSNTSWFYLDSLDTIVILIPGICHETDSTAFLQGLGHWSYIVKVCVRTFYGVTWMEVILLTVVVHCLKVFLLPGT